MHQQRQADKADYARQAGLHRGRDIDFPGPYDVFSPHSSSRWGCGCLSGQRRRSFTLDDKALLFSNTLGIDVP